MPTTITSFLIVGAILTTILLAYYYYEDSLLEKDVVIASFVMGFGFPAAALVLYLVISMFFINFLPAITSLLS